VNSRDNPLPLIELPPIHSYIQTCNLRPTCILYSLCPTFCTCHAASSKRKLEGTGIPIGPRLASSAWTRAVTFAARRPKGSTSCALPVKSTSEAIAISIGLLATRTRSSSAAGVKLAGVLADVMR